MAAPVPKTPKAIHMRGSSAFVHLTPPGFAMKVVTTLCGKPVLERDGLAVSTTPEHVTCERCRERFPKH